MYCNVGGAFEAMDGAIVVGGAIAVVGALGGAQGVGGAIDVAVEAKILDHVRLG